MNTGTPTSSLPGATPPPGLPDVATLARLAGEIFNTPPGAEATASALLSQVPASPQNAPGFAPRAARTTNRSCGGMRWRYRASPGSRCDAFSSDSEPDSDILEN